MAKKKKKEGMEVKGDWIVTYSDMVTLLLCFFVALFDPTESTTEQVEAMVASFNNIGMGASMGGNTMSIGRSADMGSTINALPSMDRGKATGNATLRAQALFSPEVRSNKVRITHDERGIVISLASDVFFAPASAQVNIEEVRDILIRLAGMLNSEDVRGRKFRIEGHTDSEPVAGRTDSEPVGPYGPWESNWELSTARSIAVLHFLTDLGVDEKNFQVAGFADTMPVAKENTPEERAYNRRVDVVILDDAHL
ncbi:MAG: flagellar motor protein MotB [Treponema sp.]|jgi:chemotaxis protein MotB|nr:flagellar motor protein MotB [Treponema sp.]